MNTRFFYVSDEDVIKTNKNIQSGSEVIIRKWNLYEDANVEDVNEFVEIPLFNPNLSIFENVEEGRKYILIPVDSNGFGFYDNARFIAPGTRVVSGINDFYSLDEAESYNLIVDYATMFGVRLNRFMNYNSDFFVCDERVFFESLIMKFRYFNFKPFFLSYPSIKKEIGIKKDRAVSIKNRFVELGILETVVKGSMINSGPSQVTYYTLNPKRILELFPQIYLDEDTEDDVINDIKKYLLGENI